MKSTQLLSVVFSLIMFTGVAAGNAAFAESDDIDDILEDFCEMTIDERSDILSKYELGEYAEKLATICDIEGEDEREDSLESVIDTIYLETDVYDETDDSDDIIEDFEDCVEAGNDVMESFPEKCMTDDGEVFTNTDDDSDDDRDEDFDLDDLLDRYCQLSDADKRKFLAEHPRLASFNERLANYCDLSEDEQDAIDELIEEHGDKIRMELREYSDEYSNKGIENLKDRLVMFCDLTAEKRAEKLAMHDDFPDDLRADHLRYCEMSEDEQDSFRDRMMEMMDVMMDHMKDSIHDKMTDHMDYDRLCAMAESERAAEIDDSEKLDRISDWCEMTPAEREDYKKEHHDIKEKVSEKMEKYSEKSDRLKAMIMDKRDISDERIDEIKMKFESKFGEDSDKKRSEIKMKYKDHMSKMKYKMSDERKSDVHERLAEMKAYKAELREKSSELSDAEKQQLREEFIEKAKDMQLAWISPRTQMTAGVDFAEVECREGYSLVMKASNGVVMCLHADTALKMIDRGIVVPAN